MFQAAHKSPPVVWILADDRPGNTTQSTGLARALGWPYEVKELHFTTRTCLLHRLLGAYAATRIGLDKIRSVPPIPLWPAVVIAAGWRPAPVARWVRKQSHGQTRVVQMGRKGGHVARLFDAVITCEHCCLPPHPRRIETVAPLTRITVEQLAQASERWQHLFEHVPCSYVALLVDGSTGRYRLDNETAHRLGEEVRAFAQDAGGSVFATTGQG